MNESNIFVNIENLHIIDVYKSEEYLLLVVSSERDIKYNKFLRFRVSLRYPSICICFGSTSFYKLSFNFIHC